MSRVHQNNYSTTITSPSVQTGDLVMDVALPPDPLNPGEWIVLTIVDDLQAPTKLEIIKCTGISGSTLTIERSQEGTQAKLWSSGNFVECRVTAGSFDGIFNDSGDVGSVRALYGEPQAGTEVTNAVEFDYADGDYQYHTLTQSGTVLTVNAASMPVGSMIRLELYGADTYVPDISAFTPMLNEAGVVWSAVTLLFAEKLQDGTVRYAFGGYYTS